MEGWKGEERRVEEEEEGKVEEVGLWEEMTEDLGAW